MSNNNPLPNPPPAGDPLNNPSATWERKDAPRLLVAGFLGGLATPLILPVQEFLRSHHYPSEFSLGYWILGAVLGGVGALMVWLLKETDVKKALMLGASLPAFFTSLGGAVQNSGANLSAAVNGLTTPASLEEGVAGKMVSFFVTSSYAQSTPSSTATPSARSVNVTRTAPFAYTLELLDARGNAISPPREVKVLESSRLRLTLPENAAAIRFTAGDAVSTQNITAKSGEAMDVTLQGDGLRRKFDVGQVFGKAAELVPDRLKIDAKAHQ
jgi:hypothetical protein